MTNTSKTQYKSCFKLLLGCSYFCHSASNLNLKVGMASEKAMSKCKLCVIKTYTMCDHTSCSLFKIAVLFWSHMSFCHMSIWSKNTTYKTHYHCYSLYLTAYNNIPTSIYVTSQDMRSSKCNLIDRPEDTMDIQFPLIHIRNWCTCMHVRNKTVLPSPANTGSAVTLVFVAVLQHISGEIPCESLCWLRLV